MGTTPTGTPAGVDDTGGTEPVRPAPPSSGRSNDGCAVAVVAANLAVWALLLMAIIWKLQAMKYRFLVYGERTPAVSVENRVFLPLVVGLSCWVMALIAVRARRGAWRRMAVGWAFVFAGLRWSAGRSCGRRRRRSPACVT